MKKIICAFTLFIFVFCLSACNDNGSSDEIVSNCSNNNADNSILTPAKENLVDGITVPAEYDTIITNIINAYPWNNDEINMVSENPELSYMYRKNSALFEVGFALIDLDSNGQEELIISGVDSPFVYDLYTISEGQIVHLFDSGERYSYYLKENGYIENQWSGSAALSGHDFYKLNDGKLEFIERITMDAYYALDIGLIKDISEATDDNAFFRSKSDKEDDYELVSFDVAMNTIDNYQNSNSLVEIEYILLSEYKK